MSLSETISAKIAEAGGRLTVRSALNPILWLCFIVSLPILVASQAFGPIQPALLWLAVAPVAAAIFGFLFLLFFDRDKLQSEDYQIRKKTLELVQEKGGPAIPAVDLEVVEGPDRPALPSGEERQS